MNVLKYTKSTLIGFTFALATGLTFSSYANTPQPLSLNQIIFEKNEGQHHLQILYSVIGLPFMADFKKDQIQLTLNTSTADKKTEDIITLSFSGANKASLTGVNPLTSKSHFYSSENKIEHVPHYEKIRYHSVYEGTDVVFYNNEGNLQYDFILSPGANPEKIKITINGAKKLDVDDQGQLLMHLQNDHRFVMKTPFVYQLDENQKPQKIPASYALKDNVISFQLDQYDKTKDLIIDPQLIFSTFIGGNGNDGAPTGKGANRTGIAFCSSSNSTDVLYDNPYGGLGPFLEHIRCAKLDPEGNLIYLTRVGAQTGNVGSFVYGLAPDGRLLVGGSTAATDFPVTPNAAQPAKAGMVDAVVLVLNKDDGTLEYASYLGGAGNDRTEGVVADNTGNIYVTGVTPGTTLLQNIGITPNKIGPVDQNLTGALTFVAKITPQGNVDFATIIGGATNPFSTVTFDNPRDIAVDDMGNIHVVGTTFTNDFPVTAGSFLPTRPLQTVSGNAGFYIKLDPMGTQLLYGSYLGGPLTAAGVGTVPQSVSIGPNGQAVINLFTNSTDLPVTSNAFDKTLGEALIKAAIVILSPLGNGVQDLLYSSYFGGSSLNTRFDCSRNEVDKFFNIYLACSNFMSTDYPVTFPANIQATNVSNMAMMVINPTFAAPDQLVFSTLLGGNGNTFGNGVGMDGKGHMYALGFTTTPDFPTFNAIQPVFGGGNRDAFVTKFHIWDEINIDIKPGQAQNIVPISSNGLLEVAILSSSTLNAPQVIDPKSIVLGGSKVKLVGNGEKALCHTADVNQDNRPDLVCKVEINMLQTSLGDTELVLMAKSHDGQIFFGKDDVTIVP